MHYSCAQTISILSQQVFKHTNCIWTASQRHRPHNCKIHATVRVHATARSTLMQDCIWTASQLHGPRNCKIYGTVKSTQMQQSSQNAARVYPLICVNISFTMSNNYKQKCLTQKHIFKSKYTLLNLFFSRFPKTAPKNLIYFVSQSI